MKLPTVLFALYFFLWTVLAIDPWYREDWLLENVLVFITLPIVIWAHRRKPFSHESAWMLFFFFVLHAIGAHYTYAEMPWFSALAEWGGWERNHYDRLVHFLFGFLLFMPLYELFTTFHRSRGSMMALTFTFLIAASGVYEVLEWLATQLTHPELGVAFLGIQGDMWDAQKDMALGYAGTLLALAVFYRRILKT